MKLVPTFWTKGKQIGRKNVSHPRLLRLIGLLPLTIFPFISSHPANCKTITLVQTTLSVPVQGIDLSLPIETIVDNEGDALHRIRLRANIDLSDLVAKIDPILVKSGVENVPNFGGSLSYKGTLLSIEANSLRAKVHFRLDPPALPATNGSVTVIFKLIIKGDKIAAEAEKASLSISNDLDRALAQGLNLDDRITNKILESLNQALSDPGAVLQLPPQVSALGIALASANFDSKSGNPIAVITGILPDAVELLIPF